MTKGEVMHVLKVFDDKGGTLPVEIQEGVEYVVTVEAEVSPELFERFFPGAEIVDGGVRYRGVGRAGVQEALCRLVRDMSLDGRFNMWLNSEFLDHHEQQQLRFLAVQDVVLEDARSKVDEAVESGAPPNADDVQTAQMVMADMVQTMNRLEAITMARAIARVLRELVDRVEEDRLDVEEVVDDELMREYRFLSPNTVETFGAFAEEFCYRLSRRTAWGAPGCLLPLTVVPASDLVLDGDDSDGLNTE